MMTAAIGLALHTLMATAWAGPVERAQGFMAKGQYEKALKTIDRHLQRGSDDAAAVRVKDEVLLAQAEEVGTPDAFLRAAAAMSTEGAQLAKSRAASIAFDAASSDGSVTALEGWLRHFDRSEHAPRAREMLLRASLTVQGGCEEPCELLESPILVSWSPLLELQAELALIVEGRPLPIDRAGAGGARLAAWLAHGPRTEVGESSWRFTPPAPLARLQGTDGYAVVIWGEDLSPAAFRMHPSRVWKEYPEAGVRFVRTQKDGCRAAPPADHARIRCPEDVLSVIGGGGEVAWSGLLDSTMIAAVPISGEQRRRRLAIGPVGDAPWWTSEEPATVIGPTATGLLVRVGGFGRGDYRVVGKDGAKHVPLPYETPRSGAFSNREGGTALAVTADGRRLVGIQQYEAMQPHPRGVIFEVDAETLKVSAAKPLPVGAPHWFDDYHNPRQFSALWRVPGDQFVLGVSRGFGGELYYYIDRRRGTVSMVTHPLVVGRKGPTGERVEHIKGTSEDLTWTDRGTKRTCEMPPALGCGEAHGGECVWAAPEALPDLSGFVLRVAHIEDDDEDEGYLAAPSMQERFGVLDPASGCEWFAPGAPALAVRPHEAVRDGSSLLHAIQLRHTEQGSSLDWIDLSHLAWWAWHEVSTAPAPSAPP